MKIDTKEKAEELVGQFFFLVETKKEQKECAIRIIDQCLLTIRVFTLAAPSEYCEVRDFLLKVKEDINAL